MTVASSKRVIVVDDDEDIVFALQRWLKAKMPSLHVVGLSDSRAAMEEIQREAPDLLITDLTMPDLSGVELLLGARKLAAAMPAIVITAYNIDLARERLPYERIHFFNKPFPLAALVASIEELLAPSAGFVGAVSLPLLPDLIQILCLARSSAALHIENGGEAGALWFDQGEIVHAVCAGLSGAPAVYHLLTWTGGQFSMANGEAPPERTITASWQEVLLEGCRRLDEGSYFDRGQDLPLEEPDEDSTRFDPVQDRRKTQTERRYGVANVKDTLEKLTAIDGFLAASIVDSNSGMMLGSEGGGAINMEVAAAGNTEVVRAKRKTMKNLNLKDTIEDILITLGQQYHLIRPLISNDALFIYLVLDKGKSNLALARHHLSTAEKDLVV
jgi:CheY-like chemotaxis protein